MTISDSVALLKDTDKQLSNKLGLNLEEEPVEIPKSGIIEIQQLKKFATE